MDLIGVLCTVLCWGQKGLILFLRVLSTCPGMVLNVPSLDFHATDLDCPLIGEVGQV